MKRVRWIFSGAVFLCSTSGILHRLNTSQLEGLEDRIRTIGDSPSTPDNATMTSLLATSPPIPFAKELQEANLPLSFRHHTKFNTNKFRLPEHAKANQLFATINCKRCNKHYAVILNDEYAFRHIFKNGGLARKPLEVRGKKLIAPVRDPIDHFLSGWQECGERNPETMEWTKTSDGQYDGRIKRWLQRVKDFALKEPFCNGGLCPCGVHSFPQVNFLLTPRQTVSGMIALVGDLRELPELVKLVGFEFDHSKQSGRNASATEIKSKHFPVKKHLISNATMKEICDFVSLDYFLFDFEPPEACKMTLSING